MSTSMSTEQKEVMISLIKEQQKALERQLAILQGTDEDASTPTEVQKKAPKAKKEEKEEKKEKKEKKPPTEYQKFTSEVSKLLKEAMAGDKMKPGFHTKVAGYMQKTAKTSATLENVIDAMKYLNAHPDYVSAHAEKMSSKGSVSEKKEAKAKAKTKGNKKIVIMEDEEVADEDGEVEMELWEHEGESYMRSQYNDLTTTDDIKYVGFWNGSEIDTSVKMPLRIKKFIDSF